MIQNIVGWFEVPVNDMERAIKFYEAVFDIKIQRNKIGTLDMGWFPWIDGGMGANGSLVHHPEYYKPSTEGTLIYFTAFSGDLSNELAKAELAGGKVLMPKTQISEEIGFMALLLDSEGNRIALHSRK
jgi:uncharacterized protein